MLLREKAMVGMKLLWFRANHGFVSSIDVCYVIAIALRMILHRFDDALNHCHFFWCYAIFSI